MFGKKKGRAGELANYSQLAHDELSTNLLLLFKLRRADDDGTRYQTKVCRDGSGREDGEDERCAGGSTNSGLGDQGRQNHFLSHVCYCFVVFLLV
jgi:hypothetical protein